LPETSLGIGKEIADKWTGKIKKIEKRKRIYRATEKIGRVLKRSTEKGAEERDQPSLKEGEFSRLQHPAVSSSGNLQFEKENR